MPVLLAVVAGLLASYLHWSASSKTWGHFLVSLIYLPIGVAAIRFGALAAICVALAGGALHALARLFGDGGPWLYNIAETLLFVCVGWIAALLAGNLRTAPAKTDLREAQEPWPSSTLTRVVVGLVRQLGTPVASIEGAAWMLEDSRLPEEKRREFVGIVRKESHRLSRILSNLLDFTRPRLPRFRPLDVSALVNEVIHLADPKDGGPAVLFHKRIPPGLPQFHGDPEWIQQGLLNLVMNAIEASPNGGQIEISARVEGGNLVITVEDHGRGVPEAALGRIFEPFFTTRPNNLGLGLSVAQQIAAEHHGKITLDNSTNKGTAISMVLPLVPQKVHGRNRNTAR